MNIKKIAFTGAASAIMLGAMALPALAGKPAVQTLNGGGQIIDANYKISFGGNIKKNANSIKGQFQANFHNVSDADITGGRFHSTEMTTSTFYPSDSDTCTAAMNVFMSGRFNGEAGWKLVLRAGDNDDTVRLTLTSPGGDVYDTHSGDFADESSCVGSARTGLDRGNLTIKL